MSRGLIVPSKEKKKEKKPSRLLKKLGRSKTENVGAEPQRAPGLVGLLETMRVQMEVVQKNLLIFMFILSFVGSSLSNLILPFTFLHFSEPISN